MLDHKLLNKIEALGPPTLENLSRFIWERVQHAGRVTRVTIHRDSCGESCTYYGPQSLTVIARSVSDAAIHSFFVAWIASRSFHRAALRATRWLAMTENNG